MKQVNVLGLSQWLCNCSQVLSVYIIVYDYVVYLKDRVREREREGGERRGRDKQKRRPPTC